MIKIADLIGTLGKYLEAQRQLEHCRKHATGDVDYYSYSYAQDLKQAEETLKQTLNGYIDQRIAQRVERFNTPRPGTEPLPAF